MSDGQQGGLIRHEQDLPVAPASEPSEITGLIRLAIERDLDVEKLERLVALRERVMDREAAAAFAAALAGFQRECPPVPRSRTGKIVTKSGGSYSYTYADMEQIVRTVSAPAHANGLSWTFDTEDVADNRLRGIATLRHVLGHSITASHTVPVENASGMSPQQKPGAARMYACRIALTNALGLTTTDQDDDGQDPLDAEPLDAEQVGWIDELLHDLHGDRARFLAALRAETAGDLTRGQWRQILTMLRAKAAEAQNADAIARVDKLLKAAP
jgi:hypothetical protein